jgi:hypothetical protein
MTRGSKSARCYTDATVIDGGARSGLASAAAVGRSTTKTRRHSEQLIIEVEYAYRSVACYSAWVFDDEPMVPTRADDRLIISCWRLAVAFPHSAISPSVRPQPVQMLELVFSVQIALQGDDGRWVMTRSRIEPFVPPDRRGQLVRDRGGIRMRRVDQDIAIQPRRDRRHNQYR